MRFSSRRRQLATALALSPLFAQAQTSAFPNRPITLIVPFPAGGATDNLVRATPDGYTLSIMPEPVFRLPHLQKMQFDPLNDFSYVIHLSGYALGIATRSQSAWKNWADVVADAKRRPGQISYGTTGVNGTMHITIEEMAQRTGIKLNHVPYKGESEIIAALMGGHIDLGSTAGGSKGLEDPATQTLLERLNQENAYLDSEAYTAFVRQRYEFARQQVECLGLKTTSQ